MDPICNVQADRDPFLFAEWLEGPVHDSPGRSATVCANRSRPICIWPRADQGGTTLKISEGNRSE